MLAGQAVAPRVPSISTPAECAADTPAGVRAVAHQAVWVDARGLAEGGLLADVGIILDLATIYLPFISPILAVAVPAPFAVLMLRRGPRATLLATAVAGFLISILAGPHYGWRMAVQAGAGMLVGWAMRRRLSWPVVLALGTLLITTVAFVAALGAVVFTGLPLRDLVQELRNALVILAGVLAWIAGILHQRSLWLQVRPSLVGVGDLMLRWWPVLLYIYSACVTVPIITCYYAIANGTARVLGHDVRAFPPRRWVDVFRMLGTILLAPMLVPRALWSRCRRLPRGSAPTTEGSGK
jgi:hypothetical protein